MGIVKIFLLNYHAGLWLFLAFALFAAPSRQAAAQPGTATPESQRAQQTQPAPSSPQAKLPPTPPPVQYTLTPETREKAIAYSRLRYTLNFISTALTLGILLLLWRVKIAVAFRDWARRVSARSFVQCLVYVLLFLAAVSLLMFPLDYYSGFVLEHRFGLAVQGFGSWLGDWVKDFLVSAVLGTLLAWVFYGVVRRSPLRWWCYFWLATIPLVLAVLLLEPFVIEPLFFNFTPLQKTQPVLTERIEQMLSRAGLRIPPSRIYEMNASSKTKTLNAYVAGIGASKRVVVWDNTLRKMDSDEILLVLGHEAGHYVLHHIPKGFAFVEAIFLGLFYLGFVAVNRLVERVGPRTGLEGVGDLAALPLVLLVFTVLVFFASPIFNGMSRYLEHQADQFGLEVAYGVVPDPNSADIRAFQILGEEDLSDPDPSPFIRFWLYDHPPLDERIRFAASYKPWAEGKPLQFVHPPR